MKKDNLKSPVVKLIAASLFSALTCIASILIQFQIPLGGYLNMGDCMVLLSAWTLGPVYGSLAAGIGSMLADMIFGYFTYAPGTFVIKTLVALAASLVFKALDKSFSMRFDFVSRIISGALGETIMVLGYFAYESIIMGLGAGAAANIPWNGIQAVFGVIASVALIEIIVKNKALNKYYSRLQ